MTNFKQYQLEITFMSTDESSSFISSSS